ncbi:MAG: DCC1-like thiol-disulfide oxidoreductase family protein [Acidobacteriia bacterium]|nr:DCC1-like thiol-disulfide oxidoreductase family protein [Terriglobia bacterium]
MLTPNRQMTFDFPENSGRGELYTAIYDGQCEICQAFISWLRILDRHHRVSCVPIEPERLKELHPNLQLEACLRELHVLTPSGGLYVGWDGVAQLARLFPPTWVIGQLGRIPPFRWLGRLGYRFIARNRYALSKCRGGACRVARPESVRKNSLFSAFWSCYWVGLMLRLPLIVLAGVRDFVDQAVVFIRTFRRRLIFPGGKLSIAFLGGFPCDVVPLVFGELFTTVLYDGIVVDPGSPCMRRSLARHLRHLPKDSLRAVVATHHHEEHVGNLNWVSRQASVPLYVSRATAQLLQSPGRLPWVRAAIIGQPECLQQPFELLPDQMTTQSGHLEVIEAPGHCDDQVVLYDRQEKILLAGDAFMGTYFATPNPDVDSRKWINTLERLLVLDIDVLVEGHGHIHTLRPDFPDLPGIVIRQNPKVALQQKLSYLRWLRDQIEAGMSEGLTPAAVEATCFPWGRGRTWESFSKNELIRVLSLGHFSRSELVRSFVRDNTNDQVLPTVYQARLYSRSKSSKETP